jgi:hypothetical protein
MTKHTVSDDGDLRKYYAAIPNLVFDIGLNPYELALYAHFKKAAGDKGGVCWKSRATIAKESGMSAGMVTKARQALEIPRPEIGNRPLITVTEEPSKTGGKPTCRVAITDVWLSNMSKYSTSPHDIAPSYHDVEAGAPSPRDRSTSHSDRSTSPHVPKEEPIKNNQEEYKRDFLAELKTDPLYSHVDFDFQIGLMQRWLARPENKGRRMTERFVLNWLAKIDRPVTIAAAVEETREAKEERLRLRMGWPKIEQRAS